MQYFQAFCLIFQNSLSVMMITIFLYSLMSCLFCKQLMHDSHKHKQRHHIHWKERNTDMIGDQPEQRRHKAGAHIGAGHLYANDGL